MRQYVKIDLTHNEAQIALARCEVAFKIAHPTNSFSCNMNPEETLCWVLTTPYSRVEVGGAVLDIEVGSNLRASNETKEWAQGTLN